MREGEAKFMAYDWNGGEFKLLPTNNVVEAIHLAWNYEFDVHEVATERIIFSGSEGNDANSVWLEPYGLRLIDNEGYRRLQNVETGEIFKADWET